MLLIITIYLVLAIAIYLWDAFIGFGFEFDGRIYPPLGLVVVFWPLVFPLCVLGHLYSCLEDVKYTRKEKAKNLEKIRVAAMKEQQKYLLEIEEEIKLNSRNL